MKRKPCTCHSQWIYGDASHNDDEDDDDDDDDDDVMMINGHSTLVGRTDLAIFYFLNFSVSGRARQQIAQSIERRRD